MGEGLVYWLGGLAACGWVWRARRRYARAARALTPGEMEMFSECFSRPLLESVRVAVVERIELPGAGWARRAVRAEAGPLAHEHGPGGIALGSLVVIAGREPVHVGVLFHELVHAAQYRRLGTRGFLSLYLRQWIEGGRSYFDIGLERQAYDLQIRFECGESMDVEAEVSRWGSEPE